MITLGEAQQYVLDRCSVLDVVAVPCREATGLVLAADVVAAEDVPPFANSAVDGYAVIARSVAGASVDRPVVLPVVGEIAAGAHSDHVVLAGEAVRIMTGAPVPAGADAIVMVENTERVDGGAAVAITRPVDPGVAVRAAGDDVRAGTLLFGPGHVVTPAVSAVLASVNAAVVSCVRRPRVAVLSTGDELVDDGSALRPGQIRESNRTMLVGCVRDAGAEPVDFGIVADDEAVLESALRRAAATCDAIVTSGGVSMGDYDVVKAVLSRIADMRWMQIAIKPAKPFAFGLLGADGARTVPAFGLPGNPVSSLVSFEALARPALRRMAGHRTATMNRPSVLAVAPEGLPRRPDGKTHLARVSAEFAPDGRVHCRSIGVQGSHQLAATSLANGIAVLPDGDGVRPGGDVTVWLLAAT